MVDICQFYGLSHLISNQATDLSAAAGPTPGAFGAPPLLGFVAAPHSPCAATGCDLRQKGYWCWGRGL